MATQGIVADAQPFIDSELPIHLKAVVAKRIKVATPCTYKNYLQTLDNVIANLETMGVFTSEKSLTYALKKAKTQQGEISNQALIRLLFEQQRLQQIFAKIKINGTIDDLSRTELEFLLQHPAENVRTFVNKYQAEFEQALERRYNEDIDPFLVGSFTTGH